MQRVIFVVALAVLGISAYIYFTRPAIITNYPSAGTDIIALGDSLIYGTGAPKGQDFVSLLSDKIGQPIVNLGVPGDTTAKVLARLRDIDRYQPKVVLLLVGGNDYLRRVDRDQTFKNLGTIIDDLHRRGAIVLLLGIRGGVLNDNFKNEFEVLRDTYKTAYVSDILSGLLGNSTYMDDEIHPNAAGHARVAERIYPELVKLLK